MLLTLTSSTLQLAPVQLLSPLGHILPANRGRELPSGPHQAATPLVNSPKNKTRLKSRPVLVQFLYLWTCFKNNTHTEREFTNALTVFIKQVGHFLKGGTGEREAKQVTPASFMGSFGDTEVFPKEPGALMLLFSG